MTDAIATRFVLVAPSHAGNVGAVARAMKVMGFDDLVLVRPRWPDVLTRTETVQRASGADDILQRASVVDTLDAALAGMSHLCATVMTARDFGPPTRTPRDHFAALLGEPSETVQGAEVPVHLPRGVALLFGCERHGMANDDVYRCHVALSIPANPAYGSLNLAAAVQLIAYDWRMALAAHQGGWSTRPQGVPEHVAADAPALAGMLAHWREALLAVGFLDPAAPKRLMPRLQQLFGRARPSADEINLLRGIAKTMQRAAAKQHDGTLN